MIICVCNNISEKKIAQLAATENIVNIKSLQEHIPICNQCKRCATATHCLIKSLLIEKSQKDQLAA